MALLALAWVRLLLLAQLLLACCHQQIDSEHMLPCVDGRIAACMNMAWQFALIADMACPALPAGAEHEHHKHHEQGVQASVDTPDESIGTKIKKVWPALLLLDHDPARSILSAHNLSWDFVQHLPGTEEHKIHQANKQQGGTGMGSNVTGSGGGMSSGNVGGSSAY